MENLKYIDEYFKHLPTCTMMQDWTESQQAMGDTPEKLRDENWHIGYSEMRQKMNTCTCGRDEKLQHIKERHFTIDQIEFMREQAYGAGFEAGGQGDHFRIDV